MVAIHTMSRTSSNATHTDSTKRGNEQAFDWVTLVPLLVHPIKVVTIEAMVWIGVPLSATDLSKVLEQQIGLANISYHLRSLAKAGVIKVHRRRRVRGAVETFYRLPDRMLVSSSDQSKAA